MAFSGDRLAHGGGLRYLKVANNAETTEPAKGKRVILIAYQISAGAEAEIKLSDGTTALAFNLAANGGASYAGGPYAPAYEFKKGAKVKVEGEADGHLTYVIL